MFNGHIEMNMDLAYYRGLINQAYLANEAEVINKLVDYLDDYNGPAIQDQARTLATAIRTNKNQQTFVEAFLNEYQLNSDEGIILMEIAEALLRIPDRHTQDVFLQEKLSKADWHKHLQQSESLLVNFSTQALDLTGKLEHQFKLSEAKHQQLFSQLSSRIGLPLIRTALKQAMQQLAYQFVIAETIEKAIYQAQQKTDYLYSFDMLGEAALTTTDAERYLIAYTHAINELAKQVKSKDPYKNPSISIKLSALYPRYETLKHKSAIQQLSRKLLYLVKKARHANIGVTVDAEESERLDMSLAIFSNVLTDPVITGWPGFGLAVQAYQKRAFSTIHYVAALAKSLSCIISVRLVKGAYWDSEIKQTQVNGLKNYPVFTHKAATDLSYLACAKLLLSYQDNIYPQFATHNAHTVAAILNLGENHPGYEFQQLHGMGEQLYSHIRQQFENTIPCRIYAPVGIYQDLLPYLIRRLLENGANTSFINQLENPSINIEKIIADPVYHFTKTEKLITQIVLPKNLYGKRINSTGVNLSDLDILTQLQHDLNQLNEQRWQAYPLVNGQEYTGDLHKIFNPANTDQLVGQVMYSDSETIELAIDRASSAFKNWRLSNLNERQDYLLKTAELLEKNQLELVALCIREAGKTIKDALAEIREAIDFCRYYAQSAVSLFENPLTLPGPTGEKNQLYHYGRGVFVCISPWNFPIAIFIGQVTAALASGNTVIAKPAQQTSLIAMRCVQLLHQAGIPKQVLHFLPGDGASIGNHIWSDNRIAGVAFTGSLSSARYINQQLSKLETIIPMIAETGGQNVMICDSSAHIEQLIQDAVLSAFNSAGQRCSALRVLFIPNEIADNIIDRIIGVMHQLVISDPLYHDTDIGPLISECATKELSQHVEDMRHQATILCQLKLDKHLHSRCFFPPTLIELNSLSQLKQENFGPVLHIIRYQTNKLDDVIESVNNSGYGLTLGIHSRIETTIDTIVKNSKVGNIYVNRNMIAAVVGIQPFGGMGLSGTGPKAGGPNYLQRFACEQTVTTNTTAIGGNASLLVKNLAE